MSEAVEWARLGFDVFKYIVSWGLTILQFMFVYVIVRSMWHVYTEGKHGDMPHWKVLLRRIYCRHKDVAYISNPHLSHIGRLSKHDPRKRRCASCGIDIDANRPEEQKR